MDLRQLRYLVALAEEGSFTRASQRLHVAQPHVSRQIAALERATDARLVNRGPRGVSLTPAGEALATYAREILWRIEDAGRVTHDIASGATGQLSVASVSSGFSYIVPTVLRAMSERMPGIVPLIYPMEPVSQVDALRDGRIDVGILRDSPAHSGLLFEQVLDEPLWALLPEDHPLAARAEVGLAELAYENFVLFARHVAPFGFDFLVGACLEAGFSPKIVAEAPNDHVKASLVAGGLGVSLVLWSARHLVLPGVAYRPIVDAPTLAMHLAWRRGNDNPLISHFRDLCRTRLRVTVS